MTMNIFFLILKNFKFKFVQFYTIGIIVLYAGVDIPFDPLFFREKVIYLTEKFAE